MPGLNQITTIQLSRLLGTPETPAIIDLRIPEDIASAPWIIPTSRLVPHTDLEAVLASLAGRRVVTVCQRGLKISDGAAALLRTHGITAENLEGGTEAWAAQGLPLTPIAALPETHLWVTRYRPKIDRIACPWLIRRFVDPAARFLFVAPSEVQGVADRFGALPFDIEGAPYSHRGDGCTFDTMLAEWHLATPALDRLALVIRAADTDRHDLAPQAAGLLAMSVGLSRLYRDDLEQLQAGIGLYDALYRWARDGYEEGHDWPAGRA